MPMLRYFFIYSIFVLGLFSCNNTPKPTDTLSSGTIDISVDEAYKPIIEQEKHVFDSCYPDAKISIHYKPEAECIKDFFDNKARIVLVSRDLSNEEKKFCEQRQIYNTSLPLALDAIAIVVNNASADTEMSMNVLKGILTGEYKTKYTVVFDNQASGMATYVTDSVLGGGKLGNNVFAVKGDSAVIEYVAKNPNAIGFVGLSFVCDPEDNTSTGTFIKTVRVVAMENAPNTNPHIDNSGLHKFNLPYQAIIARKAYPLTRKLFYINRESYPGLGTGFANFLGREQGQLIFAHSHLFPLKMNIVIREADIKHD